ncbi:MAG: ABC transporter permease [Aerococcaceae bacterium]|nr:ABC transporter permease [Aerococcaceae bacterium]
MSKQETKTEEIVSRPQSGLEIVTREFQKDPIAIVSLVLLVGIMLTVFIAPFFIDGDVGSKVDLFNRFTPPGEGGYILGADEGGRDVLAQLIIGARNSLVIGWSVTILSEIISVVYGLISGYYGGRVDDLMMRVVDFMLLLPHLLIIIVLVTLLKKVTMWHLIGIFVLFGWARGVRFYRTSILSEASKEYVKASKTMGSYDFNIMFTQVLPNISSLIVTSGILGLAGSIGMETGLSFLGFGLPVGTPSLGTLLSSARSADIIQNRWWLWVPALVLTMVMMLSISYIGQAVKRAFNSKQRLG